MLRFGGLGQLCHDRDDAPEGAATDPRIPVRREPFPPTAPTVPTRRAAGCARTVRVVRVATGELLIVIGDLYVSQHSRPRRRRAGSLVGEVRGRAAAVKRGFTAPSSAVEPGLLKRYGSLLPKRENRLIVVLADDMVGEEMVPYLAAFSSDRVVVLAPNSVPEWQLEDHGAAFRQVGNLQQTHRHMTHLGPVDILLNLRTGTGHEHLGTWTKLFFHLRRDGVYIVPRRRITAGEGTGLLGRLRNLAPSVGVSPAALDEVPGQQRKYARSIGQIMIATDFIIVGKRNKHMLKVRDAPATTRLLRHRGGGLRVTPLAKLRAGELVSPGEVTSHEAAVPIVGLDSRIPFPPLFLRRYEGRIGLGPGAVVFHDHSILPDSFRWHLEKDPINPRLDNVNTQFAQLREHHRPEKELEGSYYYLDYSNSGHFGHLMTEALAKFWGWDVAKLADPDLKVLLRTSRKDPNRPEPQLETRLLEAYGVAREDIVWVDEPVWVESLVGASPMWHNRLPYYAHPQIADVWDRLRQGIVATNAPEYRRIFVSRRVGNRHCRNIDEVEEFFVSHGFEIIHPERLEVSQQAGVFANAGVIAGFGGSGMFNLLYAKNLSTLIVLNHEAYDARNEHLLASVLGVDSHYFWSPPDLSQPENGWSYDAFQSGWAFDFDRNGLELERVLKGLS